MDTLLLLIKQQLSIIFFKKRKKSSFLVPILFLVMYFISFSYTNMMFSILNENTYKYSFYLIYFIIAFLNITTVFVLKGYLFGFKDFDLLMSLPIKKEHILISKFSSFIIFELIYAFIIMTPTMFIYGNIFKESILYYILCLLSVIIFPLFFISIALFLLILLKKFILKGKNENIISGILTLLFLFVYFYFIYKSSSTNYYMENKLYQLQNILSSTKIFDLYILGIIDKNLIYYFSSIFISLVLILISFKLFSINFISMNTQTITSKFKKINTKDLKVNSLLKTLIKKEFLKVFTNIQYTINLGTGSIFTFVCSIYILLNSDMINNFILYYLLDYNMICLFILIILGFSAHLICLTSVSISLEGKNVWVIKSLPISFEEIIFSKFIINFLLSFISTFISFVMIVCGLKFPLYFILIGIIYLSLISFFTSLSGLLINLFLPMYEFDRDIIVIKRSASSVITVILNTIIALGIGFIAYNLFINNYSKILLIIILIYLLLDILLYVIFKTMGKKLFYK